jgi:hypothetical protein
MRIAGAAAGDPFTPRSLVAGKMRAWPTRLCYCAFAQPLSLATGLSCELFEPWRGCFCAMRLGRSIDDAHRASNSLDFSAGRPA